MFKQKNYFVPGLAVLVAVLLLSLPSGSVTRIRWVVGSWFLPLFGFASASQHIPADLADAALPRHELLREIQTLRQQNDQLKVRAFQADALEQENGQLRALLHWQSQAPWHLKAATVVMRDPANWWRTVQIDLGSRDGLRENLPVLTPDGLAGRISWVGINSSQVLLLGDPNCRVSAQVMDSPGDVGILGTGGPLDSSLLDLNYLPGDAGLKPGQNVVTSGLGGVFPRGIPIGKIADSQTMEYGLTTQARVKLNVDLGALDHVFVLFP